MIMETSSLASLNYDVLVRICASVSVLPSNTTLEIRRPLDSLSRTCKLFNQLCFPDLHREITIRGDAQSALSRLRERKNCQDFVLHVRFAYI